MALQLLNRLCNFSIYKQLPVNTEITAVRWASKKAGTSSRNTKGHGRPKHRGWRVQDGHYVQAGTILAVQRTLRFHPGMNVGFGRNGTLFAMEAGRVMVTCEQADPNWNHSWIIKHYEEKEGQTFYKKYFHVMPEPQKGHFKLIDRI
ncbi:39S ribosomal protein L27 [Blattella germanica]|nr:39S ribosomal protein L27 [Blattella germanica]